MLYLGLCHGNPLGLGVLGLGGDDLGDSGGSVQRSAFTAAPRTCPWSCSVMIAVQILRVANLLELCTCSHLVSNFLLNIFQTLMRILCLMMSEHVLMGDPVLIVSLDTVFYFWSLTAFVSLEGRTGLLDSVSNVGVGGQLVVKGVLEGGEYRLRFTQSSALRWTPV